MTTVEKMPMMKACAKYKVLRYVVNRRGIDLGVINFEQDKTHHRCFIYIDDKWLAFVEQEHKFERKRKRIQRTKKAKMDILDELHAWWCIQERAPETRPL